MTAVLEGDRELARKLAMLGSSGIRKAARGGINASLTPLKKAMKSAVNATPASPAIKKIARKAIAKRMVKGKMEGKVGFGVGSRKTKAGKKTMSAAKARHVAGMSGERKGVGISATNVHWFVLGTHPPKGDPREATTLRGADLKKPRKTGKVDPDLAIVAAYGHRQSAGASVEAARKKIEQIIEREARKRA